MAERARFELAVDKRPQQFSRLPLSTAQPPLQLQIISLLPSIVNLALDMQGLIKEINTILGFW